MLHQQMLDEIVCTSSASSPSRRAQSLEKLVEALRASAARDHHRMSAVCRPHRFLQVADEALVHAGIHARSRVNIRYVDSRTIEKDGIGALLKGVTR